MQSDISYGDEPKNPKLNDLWVNNSGELLVFGKTNGGCWLSAGPAKPLDQKKEDFYEYMNDEFNITKEEFINILKEKHPEVLI